MKNARSLGITAATCVLLLGAGPAKAGIPVIDVANLVQAITQVLSWLEQYKQMVDTIKNWQTQYKQMVIDYKAITGTRNLGDILNNPLLAKAVPADALTIYQGVTTGGYAGLTSAAKATRNALMLYDCSNQLPAARKVCEAELSVGAQNKVLLGNALDVASQRITQIQKLQGQISSTGDPKAIAELQARLTVEQAQVQNDANRIQLMAAMGEEEARAAEQRSREYWVNLMKPGTPSIAASFTFK